MDTMENISFDALFGIGNYHRKRIRDIIFSNDKLFSFVCIKHLGKLD